MPIQSIHSLDDPRLEPFRNLKATNRTRWSNHFIAEGLLVVERLLASRFELVSIVASRRMEAKVLALAPHDPPVYLLEHDLAERLVGYSFHTGVLACGLRRATPPLEQLIGGDDALLAVCPAVNDPENIGAIIRLCAGFGCSGLLLGSQCADPFSRRVLRVSMGTAFTVPVRESTDLKHDLMRLRSEFAFELCATVLDQDSQSLHECPRWPRMALLFGNEKHGLEPQWTGLCHRRITIPMAGGADSLNVAVAAGIFFHYFTRVATTPLPG